MSVSWRARHYRTGETVEIVEEGGNAEYVGPPRVGGPHRSADWVAPAFFDMQVNGARGVNFTSDDLSTDGVAEVTSVCREHGTSLYLPTVVTSAEETLRHSLGVLAAAVDSMPEVRKAVPGIHVEGPWINGEDGPRGAHPRAHVRPPNLEEFLRLQDTAGGHIRLVTLAPELPGALSLIESLVARDVRVAIGHTLATAGQVRDAVHAGASMSTHLGNGCGARLPRDNAVMAQLAAAELWASVIVDGNHVPDMVISYLAHIKTAERTILVSDVYSLAGLPPGRYELNGRYFELSANRITVAGTNRLAGAAVFLDGCVGRAATIPGVSLAGAIEMATATPRRYMGLPSAEVVMGASLVLFDSDNEGHLNVCACLT